MYFYFAGFLAVFRIVVNLKSISFWNSLNQQVVRLSNTCFASFSTIWWLQNFDCSLCSFLASNQVLNCFTCFLSRIDGSQMFSRSLYELPFNFLLLLSYLQHLFKLSWIQKICWRSVDTFNILLVCDDTNVKAIISINVVVIYDMWYFGLPLCLT